MTSNSNFSSIQEYRAYLKNLSFKELVELARKEGIL